jgi:hemoglobin-like flavoprotein
MSDYVRKPRAGAFDPGMTPTTDRAPATTVALRPSFNVVRLVRFSCQRMFPQETFLVGEFHKTLQANVPSMLRLDPHCVQQLSERIIRSVLWSALAPDPVPAIEAALQALGYDHHRQGFPRDGYLGLGHALLRAVRIVIDGGWSVELSSAWVAYYSWLAEQFQAGADAVQKQPGLGPDLADRPKWEVFGLHNKATDGPAVHRAPAEAHALDDVLAILQTRYFPHDARGMESICTRVMLQTGVDLRAPRPDQRMDLAVITDVYTILMIMGYPMTSLTPASSRSAQPASASITSKNPHRRRWLYPFRRWRNG